MIQFFGPNFRYIQTSATIILINNLFKLCFSHQEKNPRCLAGWEVTKLKRRTLNCLKTLLVVWS